MARRCVGCRSRLASPPQDQRDFLLHGLCLLDVSTEQPLARREDAEIPQGQGLDPNTGPPWVDGRRLRRSVLQVSPVSEVLGDDNLLIKILLHLPPNPSSLPRASTVCKRWGSILSDPQFRKNFRKHHRKPPLLGFFEGYADRFTSIMDSPDRITAACFSLPKRSTPYSNHGEYMGCRHGLAVVINTQVRQAVVWDPLTSQQHNVAFPPGLDDAFTESFCMWHGTVFPFKLVLVCCGGYNTQAFCSVYDLASGVWGGVFSTAISHIISLLRPSILVRNELCWLISRGDILVFDFEIQSLNFIEKPACNYISDGCFQLLRMEDGGLSLAILLDLTIQLWVRKSNCDGVVEWVMLQKTIPLEGIFPRIMHSLFFVGYDEDTNVIVLTTTTGNFTLEVDSMKIKRIVKRNTLCFATFYSYTNFYTAGNGSLSTLHKLNANYDFVLVMIFSSEGF
ncbi:hypothetical protein VPH35_102101 [Triticum aestivum]